MKSLTKTEEQIMQIIWSLEKCFVKDIIAKINPKPPYNTISSVVRLLEEKKFVAHKAYGKTHEYYPIISKKQYRKFSFSSFFNNYFEGSMEQLVSHFMEDEQVDQKEVEALLKKLKDQEKT